MSIYGEFGVRTIINVSGASTRVGGALMPPVVVEAMARAAEESVSMPELQAGASRYIASVTGAEAGYVTAGASSALTLGAAAIMAGMDPGAMDRLPDTSGLRSEFIIAREHRNGYDHAVPVAGGTLVEVGMNEVVANAGVRRTEAWEYEAAVTERTAAIYYGQGQDSEPPLAEVVAVARRRGLPVLVDAAGELPPRANLRAFVDAGDDEFFAVVGAHHCLHRLQPFGFAQRRLFAVCGDDHEAGEGCIEPSVDVAFQCTEID